ncbi:protein AKNAD1 isoform X3 [Pangasianodon hypophthalmus]|uniref:protein AKNAD1 isoform X3 n=1 Tax=Pangasianodon hypophthalmus TaxID=310915 RepID=UPI00147FE7A9|nr:protein AKNAD1 isoform X3 [Pangasianodon hypophthalmus]
MSDIDDSLHFSHLQRSFTMHVSHGFAASSGLSGSFKDVEDYSKSPVSIISKHRHYGKIRDVKGNEMEVSDSQPDTLPEQKRWTHEDDNTSDEDQEELPYDGELYHHVTHCSNSLRQNSEEPFNLIKKYNHSPGAFNTVRRDAKLAGGGVTNTSGPVFGQKPHQTSIPSILLRHFSYDELFNCSRLIETETMPEVSLMDSINQTTHPASPNPHTTTGKHSIKIKTSLLRSNRGDSYTALGVTDSKTESAETETHDNNNAYKVSNQSDSSEKSKLYSSSNRYSSPGAVLVVTEDVKEEKENNVKQSCSCSPPNLHKLDSQTAKCSLGRTWSCNELKYGQGQVHYPLPDFSKVAPKVKFPKSNGVAKPGCNSAMTRAQKTPSILSKFPSSCKADVISRVLEDSDWLIEKPKMFKDDMTQYSGTQDLQTKTLSEPIFSIFWGKKAEDIQHTKDNIRAGPHTFPSTKAGLVEEKKDRIWSSLSEQKSLTEGHRLTIELKDIINQFTMQVEEFKICINNMSMTVEEQQMVFKRMMEVQDQLERNYMSKKEEHRALEMQNYMGLKLNTGEFDPDRLVEGEIFQLGMHLEDLKEQIDRNAYCMLSPLPSSTTSTALLHGEFIPSSSLQPALHKESVFSHSSKSSIMDKEEESYKDSFEVPSTVDSPPSCPRENRFRLCIYNQMSCITREDEKGSVSMSEEEDNHKDLQAKLSDSLSPQHQRTPSSDAIHAMQYEVSCLRTVLEESLGPLPYCCTKMAPLRNMSTREKRLRAQPHHQHKYQQFSRSRCLDTECYTTEDWVSSDTEHSKRKGTDCGTSDDNEVPDVFILTRRSRHAHSKSPTNRMSNDLNYFFPVSLENVSLDTYHSRQGNNYLRASVATTITGSNTLGNNARFGLPSHSRKNRNTGCVKPSYSLPSGFKVHDQQSEPGVTSMRCSIQSHSALLPSNIYFYKASTLPTCPHRTGDGVHRVKEEALTWTIDKALDAALLMKQITDHMAKTLSSDLAKAQLYRKLHHSERETA